MTKNKIQHQPRIPGIHRIPKGGCFHPIVAEAIVSIAEDEKRSFGFVIVDIVSDWLGVDCRTGEIFDKRKLRKAS